MNKILGKCICCQGELRKLMVMHNMPRAVQHMPGLDEIEDETGMELLLGQCRRCGLVQFDVDPVWYYKDVIRAGGGTKTMVQLRQEEYRRLLQVMKKNGVSCGRVLEIGCGKGEFLKIWDTLPELRSVSVSGIEHDPELVETARKSGLNVSEGFAEAEAKEPPERYDAFVQFNFLEHQPDPVGMLKWAKKSIIEGGYGLITVPSLEYIIQYDGYYELMRDHIAYYTVESLENVVRMAGFRPVENRMVNRDTIEMIIRSEKDSDTNEAAVIRQSAAIDVSRLQENYHEMQLDVDQLKSDSLVIWGASHQAFTLIATTNLKDKVKYIIDSAEFKQGKYSPASHIRITGPDSFLDDPAEAILIVAPGYTDEIAAIIRERFGENVQILILKEQRIVEYS